jgi:formate/nitrite transporter FocA (FNT family)
VVVFAMSLTFILLAFQAEPITATLGYIFGGLLFVALMYQIGRQKNVRGIDTAEKE